MNRKIAALAGITAVALLGAWYLLLWKPAGTQLSAARLHLSAAQSDSVSAQAEHAMLLRKRSQVPGAAAEAALLVRAAPSAPRIDTMIDQVAADAAAAGVVIHSEAHTLPVVPSPTPSSSAAAAAAAATGGGLESSSLTLQTTGTYDQLLDFVSQLQATARLVKVSSLSLGGSGSGASGTGAPAGSSTGTATGAAGSGVTGSGGAGALTASVTATFYDDASSLPPAPSTGR